MKRYFEIFLSVVLMGFINWYCYQKIDTPLSPVDIVFITFIVLLTAVLSLVIVVKGLNIADHWSFARNHTFLYRVVAFVLFFMILSDAHGIYQRFGNLLFVFLNLSILLLSLIDGEQKNRLKQEEEEKENEGMQYSDFTEDS